MQSVDAAGLGRTWRQKHVTRSVLDLRDQVTEVYDARELGYATWEFTYDYAGQRIKTAHATAMGTRYALSDSAGNPIWSRDARGIEVNRTFDDLNRPLTESSTESSTTKLRRKWRYIEYNESDPDFSDYQDANLFGPPEEVRDADGLRFFEYDWRGLVTKASHRFWDVDWTNSSASVWTDGSSWDPEVDDTARGSVSSWLSLSGLDSDTMEVSTTYDAAGRPLVTTYPEFTPDTTTMAFSTTRSYNAAGMLDAITLSRDGGTSTETIIEEATYNARGQVTGFTHGNGVETTREYDSDLERLSRIFTKLVDTTTTHFQDLTYTYDPVGNPVAIRDGLIKNTYKANSIVPNTRTFRYDPRYRLVRATGRKHSTVVDGYDEVLVSSPDENDYEGYAFRYAYDEVGNFVRNDEYASGAHRHMNYKDGRIDLFNGPNAEATDPDPESGNWQYDDNGNTTKTPRHDELGYTFDSQASYVDMGGGTEVRYLRHADQRVVRLVKKNGVYALGIYLGPFEYHDRQATTSYRKVVLHVEGHGRHAQVEEVVTGTDSDSLETFFVHGDHLGSGHVLTKDDGTLLSQEEYFPYGRSSDRRDARNRYRYIGVERDEETGLSMTGPRTYDVVSVRFLQGEPILHLDTHSAVGPWSGLSPYQSAFLNPLGYRDDSGYVPVKEKARSSERFIDELKAQGLDSVQEVERYLGRNLSNNPMEDRAAARRNRFIYTEKVGWLDMTHFMRAAEEATLRREGVGPMERYSVAELEAMSLERCRTHTDRMWKIEGVLANGAAVETLIQKGTKSYYAYEDLQSNLQGALFGAEFGHLEGVDFYNALAARFDELGAADPSTAPNWRNVPRNDDSLKHISYRDIERVKTYTPIHAPRWQEYVDEGGITYDYILSINRAIIVPGNGWTR